MGWFSSKPSGVSHHEEVHAKACRGEGLGFRWVNRRGEQVVESSIGGSSRSKAKGAVALMAGGLAGGGDGAGDVRAAEGLAHEAGVSVAEVRRRARRYL